MSVCTKVVSRVKTVQHQLSHDTRMEKLKYKDPILRGSYTEFVLFECLRCFRLTRDGGG